MFPTVRGSAGLSGAAIRATPLNAESPPAPTSRDTLKTNDPIQKLYQLRQRLVQTAVKELSRVLPETATNPKL